LGVAAKLALSLRRTCLLNTFTQLAFLAADLGNVDVMSMRPCAMNAKR